MRYLTSAVRYNTILNRYELPHRAQLVASEIGYSGVFQKHPEKSFPKTSCQDSFQKHPGQLTQIPNFGIIILSFTRVQKRTFEEYKYTRVNVQPSGWPENAEDCEGRFVLQNIWKQERLMMCAC